MAKGDPNDPTWRFITAALARAQAHARAHGYSWNGPSCFVVSGYALGLVMDTRNGSRTWKGGQAFPGDGGPTLTTDNPRCTPLAYADHYFQTRSMSGAAFLGGAVAGAAATYGYDGYKLLLLWMKRQRMATPSLMPTPFDPTAGLPSGVRAAGFIMSLFCNAIADAGDRLALKLQENPEAALSEPTEEGRYWAIEGAKDGVADNAANPLQFVDLARRLV